MRLELLTNKNTIMEKQINYAQWCEIVPERFGCYFVTEEYHKSKGAGKGGKLMYRTAEMWEGAWQCYIADIAETNRSAWIKTQFHCEYLDLRAEVIAGVKTPEYALDELKIIRDWFCGSHRLPKSFAAIYTKHLRTMEDWCGTRIKMQL